MNAKQARKLYEAKQLTKQTTPVTNQPTQSKPRKRRMSNQQRRENALYQHAERVYDTDRDYDCEEFS